MLQQAAGTFVTRNLISLCLGVSKLPCTKPEVLNAKPEVLFPNLHNHLCHQYKKKNKVTICLNSAIPDSRWLFYIRVCKTAKNIVLFFITKVA